MKELHNKTEHNLGIVFKGERFNLPADSSLIVDDEVAEFWKKVHAFIIVSEVSVPVTESAEDKESEVDIELINVPSVTTDGETTVPEVVKKPKNKKK